MSSLDRTVLSLLSEIILSFDGAIIGLTLAFGAVRSVLKYASISAALNKIKKAPEVSVSDLRSLIPVSKHRSKSLNRRNMHDQRIVVVRGVLGPKLSRKSNVLVSPVTGDKALIIQRTQTYMYSGWSKQGVDFMRMVPFVIVEKNQQSLSDFLVVNMDGSKQPLPFTTVYSHLQPINSSPYAFLKALFLPEYPTALLDVEKILPPGRDITAIGICRFKNGVPEIKACQDLPYFLSEMTKEKMILDLMHHARVIFWGSVIMGCVSVGILSYAVIRNWNKWKLWNHQRQNQTVVDDETEDLDEIPDEQLCVACMTRRRVLAFMPCGHIVCCRQCALTVERESNPKCPVCIQSIRGSMRVYYS